MTALATLAVQVVLAAVILSSIAFMAWLLWDCFAGPTARAAEEARAAERRAELRIQTILAAHDVATAPRHPITAAAPDARREVQR